MSTVVIELPPEPAYECGCEGCVEYREAEEVLRQHLLLTQRQRRNEQLLIALQTYGRVLLTDALLDEGYVSDALIRWLERMLTRPVVVWHDLARRGRWIEVKR